MTNIDFNINAQRLQAEAGKGFNKAGQQEHLTALFDLQSAALQGENRLDAMSEAALGVILKQYDGNGELIVTGDYALFPEYMQSSLNDVFANLKRTGMLAGYSLEMSEWSAFLTAEGLGYFNDKQKVLRRETGIYRKLPSDTEKLLLELVQSDNPAGLLRDRFRMSSYYENKELSGIIRELISQGYIRIPVWKDDVPQYVEIDDSARTYDEREYPVFSGHSAEPPPTEVPDENRIKQYDLFISHAGRDKSVDADELYRSLSRLGVRILYDSSILSWGDDWKQKILDGVDVSEFAIIVISENFFEDDWTEKELQQLLRRQNKGGQKTILPLLRHITPEDLYKKYPSLSGIRCLTADMSHDEITVLYAKELIKRLKQMEK